MLIMSLLLLVLLLSSGESMGEVGWVSVSVILSLCVLAESLCVSEFTLDDMSMFDEDKREFVVEFVSTAVLEELAGDDLDVVGMGIQVGVGVVVEVSFGELVVSSSEMAADRLRGEAGMLVELLVVMGDEELGMYPELESPSTEITVY